VRIEWLVSSEDEVNQIVDYLDPRNPAAAHRILTRIEQAVERLSLYPLAGRPGRESGTRELVVGRTPYIVIYSVRSDCIAIMHVIHGARQWPPEE
jgi:toxin ParE1/3/4